MKKNNKSQLETLVEVATSEFTDLSVRDSAGKIIIDNYSLKISTRIKREITKIKSKLKQNKKP